MPSETVVIVNERGLHARASAKFVGAVAKLPPGHSVTVSRGRETVDGHSIMGLMMLGAARGDSIDISVEGPAADAVLARLAGLVVDGFGED